MTNRSPIVVLLLSLVTCFLYLIYWYIKTADELKTRGGEIPHWILLFIPVANLYWIWKWSAAIEKATKGTTSGAVAFLLMFFLGPIGAAILQDKFNKVA